MPMAQALVMVRGKADSGLDSVLSPMRTMPGPHFDSSLITSTVRKRKPEAAREVPSDDDGKKVCREAAEPSRRASYGLAQTGPLLREAAAVSQQQQEAQQDAHCGAHPHDLHPEAGQQHSADAAGLCHAAGTPHPQGLGAMHHHHHPPQEPQAAGGGLLGTLFSPVFHLLHKDGAGSEALHQPPPAAAAASSPCPAGPQPLATPAPVACLPAPRQLPVSTVTQDLLSPEDAAPLRPHTPPPEAAAGDTEQADCTVRLQSPLASPKAIARVAVSDRQRQCEDARACAAVPQSPAPPPAGAPVLVAAAEESEDEYELEFDPLLFIKRLPPLEQCFPARRTSFLLPRQTRRSKRKTLVLDLDETLVHSTLDGFCRPDFTFPVEVGQVKHMVSVRQRPHLLTFLEHVARRFEVVVFTASQRVYAEQLLNVIDPRRAFIRHRVYRESCVFWEGNYLKDLTVLGRDLRDTVIVDNSPQAFGFQLDNGIPIESWYDDDADEELLRLLPFLEALAEAEDVRPHIQAQYRLRQLVEATPDPPPRTRSGLGVLFGY